MEQRRLRGDLIGVYKIMRDMDRVDKEQLFPLVEGSVEGTQVQGEGQEVWGDVRVLTIWNALSGRLVEAYCLTSFKKYLGEHLAHHNIQGYGPSAGKWD